MVQPVLNLEIEALNLDEAVELALVQLNCTRADIEVDVLQAQSSGLFGLFGKRPARICARIHDRGIIARQVLAHILTLSGLEAEVELLSSNDKYELRMHSAKPNLLIGRHGQTLDALQSLVVTMVDRQTTDRRALLIDVDGYLERRRVFLRRLCRRMISQVQQSGKVASSPPLILSERRVMHQILKCEDNLVANSKPYDSNRKTIVLRPRS